MLKVILLVLALLLGFVLSCFFGLISFRIQAKPNQEPLKSWHVGRFAFDLPKSLTPHKWTIHLRWPNFYWVDLTETTDPPENDSAKPSADKAEITVEDVSEFLGVEAELFVHRGQYPSMRLVVKLPQKGYLIYQLTQSTDKETFLRRVKSIQSNYKWKSENSPAIGANLSTRYGEIVVPKDDADWPGISASTVFEPGGRKLASFYFTTLDADDPQGVPLSLGERTFNVVKSLCYSCWCAQKTTPMMLTGHPGYEEAKRTLPFKKGAKADMPELWLQWTDASTPDPAGIHPRFSMEIASDDDHSVHDDFPQIMGIWESVLPTVRMMD